MDPKLLEALEQMRSQPGKAADMPPPSKTELTAWKKKFIASLPKAKRPASRPAK